MFHAIWTKTLRDYRIAILGWGLGLALLIYVELAAFGTQVTSQGARDSLAQLAQTFRFFGEPVAVTTPAGYATWRVMGIMPVLLGVWAVLAGARLLRRDEERGSLDVLLAAPRSRLRVLAEKLAALVVALLLIGLLIALGAIGGQAQASIPVDAGAALLAGLNVSLGALLFSLLALLLSQLLRTASAAAGWAGSLMALAFLLDGTGRVVAATGWLRYISPLFYYSLSKPLIASYGANGGALLVLLVLCATLGAASIPLFVRRDLGGVAWTSRTRIAGRGARRRGDPKGLGNLERAYRARSLRTVGLRAFAAQAPAALWWIAGLGIYAAWITGIARSTEESLRKLYATTPLFRQILGGHDIGTNAGFLASVLFSFLPLLLVVFALMQAGAWARDLDAGRLELVLSTPHGRQRVALERFGALAAALLAAPLAIGVMVLVSAGIAGIDVDGGHVAAAVLGMLPLELITAALVYLLAGRTPAGTVTGVVSGLIGLSFFASLLDSVLKLPVWLASLSIFYQYGSPITDGPRWGAWLAMAALAAVLLAMGVVQFSRGDVQRGQ